MVGWFEIRPVISSLTCGFPVRATSLTYGIEVGDRRSALDGTPLPFTTPAVSLTTMLSSSG